MRIFKLLSIQLDKPYTEEHLIKCGIGGHNTLAKIYNFGSCYTITYINHKLTQYLAAPGRFLS